MRPEVGEPEQVEASVFAVDRRFRPARTWSELHQPCLGGVEGQTVPTETFRQHGPNPARIALVSEGHDEIVGKADHESAGP